MTKEEKQQHKHKNVEEDKNNLIFTKQTANQSSAVENKVKELEVLYWVTSLREAENCKII